MVSGETTNATHLEFLNIYIHYHICGGITRRLLVVQLISPCIIFPTEDCQSLESFIGLKPFDFSIYINIFFTFKTVVVVFDNDTGDSF